MSSRWDQSDKRFINKSSETVPLAEHKILKEKYESLVIEHESLIKTLELLEKTHGFTVDDLVNKQRVALERKEVIAKWDTTFGEMQKKLKTVEKDIEYMMSVDDDIEMNGVASGCARPAKKPNMKNIVSKEDVIMLSDDEEGNQRESKNQRESNQRNSNSSHQDPFIL